MPIDRKLLVDRKLFVYSYLSKRQIGRKINFFNFNYKNKNGVSRNWRYGFSSGASKVRNRGSNLENLIFRPICLFDQLATPPGMYC